ncbi:MAG TPA: hypothetical protein VL651_07550 [Bacteroidia bacterium]|jgi:hypothetical protein|nr:hypothetical protein [Bacteroidia bacterium]
MRFLIFIALSLFASCNDESNSGAIEPDSSINSKQNIYSSGMRDTLPVVVDTPETTADSSFLNNPHYFDIDLENDSLIVRYQNRKTVLFKLQQLDSMVDTNGDGALNGKVALSANNKNAYKRINEIIKLLKSDSI